MESMETIKPLCFSMEFPVFITYSERCHDCGTDRERRLDCS